MDLKQPLTTYNEPVVSPSYTRRVWRQTPNDVVHSSYPTTRGGFGPCMKMYTKKNAVAETKEKRIPALYQPKRVIGAACARYHIISATM